MILFSKNVVNSANPPHLLRKVSDFDAIHEPEFVKRELDVPSKNRMGNEARNEIVLGKMSKIKRDLGQVGQIFVNNYFKDLADSEENLQSGVFREEGEDIENANNQSLFNIQKEDDSLTQPNLYKEKGTESEIFQENFSGDFKNTYIPKTQPNLNKDLKMHFYKHSPHKRKNKLEKDIKPLTVHLHSENMFNALPESFDYIALVGDDDKLVAVPAVKMNFIAAKVKRSRDFEPFFSTRFKRQDSSKISYKFPIKNSLPVLFLNTMPHFRINKYKRSSHLDTLENKYLREADLLIQNVNASLQMMGLNNSMQSINGGFLFNTKDRDVNLTLPTSLESEAENPPIITFDLGNNVLHLEITTKKDEVTIENQAESIEFGSSDVANSQVTIESYKFISSLPKRQSLNRDLANFKSFSKNFVI